MSGGMYLSKVSPTKAQSFIITTFIFAPFYVSCFNKGSNLDISF